MEIAGRKLGLTSDYRARAGAGLLLCRQGSVIRRRRSLT